jgi:hypothetical protein
VDLVLDQTVGEHRGHDARVGVALHPGRPAALDGGLDHRIASPERGSFVEDHPAQRLRWIGQTRERVDLRLGEQRIGGQVREYLDLIEHRELRLVHVHPWRLRRRAAATRYQGYQDREART